MCSLHYDNNQGLNWDMLCGGTLWYRAYIYIYIYIQYIYIYIYIYIYTFSNLADTFIQRDLQMRTMDIYIHYIAKSIGSPPSKEQV